MTRQTIRLFFISMMLFMPAVATAQFYFTGPSGGDFFDELNWTANPDGTGANPAAASIEPGAASAIAVPLIIDGDDVMANDHVDFGAGSLDLQAGSVLTISSATGTVDLDINAATTFTMDSATLNVGDDIFFGGTQSIANSIINTLDLTEGDVQLQVPSTDITGTTFNVGDDMIFGAASYGTIDGNTFNSNDNMWFSGSAAVITNSTLSPGDRLGIQTSTPLLIDSIVTINGGGGDLEDVFDDGTGVNSVLTVAGNTSVALDQLQEGVALTLDDSSTAIFLNDDAITETPPAGTSLVTMASFDATVTFPLQNVDLSTAVFNGMTGLSYADDPSAWNVTDWNGVDAVTLQLAVPEPSGLAMLLSLIVLACFRRKSS